MFVEIMAPFLPNKQEQDLSAKVILFTGFFRCSFIIFLCLLPLALQAKTSQRGSGFGNPAMATAVFGYSTLNYNVTVSNKVTLL